MIERKRYSRLDLDALKTRTRAEIFEILGSFDEHAMAEVSFVRATAELLDADRVPGLASALLAGDANGIAAAALAARGGIRPPPE